MKKYKHMLRKQTLAIVCFLGFCLAASHAAAEDFLYAPDYLSLLPGYSLPSKAAGTAGSGATLSGIYGREFTPHFLIEANIQSSVFETGRNNGTDFYQNGATFDLVYQLADRRAGLFTPFALGGVGGAYDDFYPKDRRGAAFIADLGLGLVSKPLFANGIRLRVDARYVYDGNQGGHGEGRFLAGLDVPLGRIEHEVRYLPGKTEIHEVVKEVAARPWVDSDGDGVDDEHDRCPNTPHGFKVDVQGCVIDHQTVSLPGVTFEFRKARLTPNAQTILDLVSHAFIDQPTLQVEIAGHTDSIGSIAVNLKLSRLRAEAVREYLISTGARPDQLIARGYGKSQPLAVWECIDLMNPKKLKIGAVRPSAARAIVTQLIVVAVCACSANSGPGVSSTTSIPAKADLPAVSLAVGPAAIKGGGNRRRPYGSTSNATACTATGAWSGSRALSNTAGLGIGPIQKSGTYTYGLTCTGPGQQHGGESQVLTVGTVPAPSIQFLLIPSAVEPGDSATIVWSSTNATSCVGNRRHGFGCLGAHATHRRYIGIQHRPAVRRRSIYLQFELLGAGRRSPSEPYPDRKHGHRPPAPLRRFRLPAQSTFLQTGQSTTFNWTTTNAASCSASGAAAVPTDGAVRRRPPVPERP